MSVETEASRQAAENRRRLLALRLRQRESATAGPPIARRADAARVPLSFAQQGLWFLERLTGPSEVYNVAQPLRLIGPLDVAVLQKSLEALVARHESLRSAFPMRDGDPIQVVQPIDQAIADVRLETLPLRGATRVEREQSLAETLLSSVAEQPFDLAHGPMLRARLLSLDDAEHVLLLVVHHIVFDGWSMGVLARELGELYARSGELAALPALPIQFGDYVVWQRERSTSDAVQRQLQYWRRQLDGLEPLELPTDRLRPAQSSYRGGLVRFELPAALLEQLKALALREDATLFMVLLAAFQTLLMRYSRQTDLGVGVPLAGRNRPELEALIGYFVNTLVLRSDLSGNPGFTELLRRVRRTALEAYENQELPFDRLVAELSPERDLSRNPLYQVAFFAAEPASAGFGGSQGLQVQVIDRDSVTSKFDLSLGIRRGARWRCRGQLRVQQAICSMRRRSSAWSAHFRNLLDGIVADSNPTRSATLPLLRARRAAADRFFDWNDTARSEPRDDASASIASSAPPAPLPRAIALVARDATLTYRELNERANRLAHHLIRLGVQTECGSRCASSARASWSSRCSRS